MSVNLYCEIILGVWLALAVWIIAGHRVQNCFGLTVWTLGRRIEIWACFSEVKPHRHPDQHVEIVPLFGWGTFFRVPAEGQATLQMVGITARRWLHAFSIPAGWMHWFTLHHRPLVFLNITTGPSAADNLEFTD